MKNNNFKNFKKNLNVKLFENEKKFDFSALLIRSRKRLFLTQAQLAKQCNLAQSTISRAEINFSKIKFGPALRILRIINWGFVNVKNNQNSTKNLKDNNALENIRVIFGDFDDFNLDQAKILDFLSILKKDERIYSYFIHDPVSCGYVLLELLKIELY